MQRAHVFVSGRVQGVFYRATTQETARNLDLTGWVKNLSDGRVEIVAEGEPSDLEDLVSWCHEGSPAARVDSVDVDWEEPADEFDDFRVRR